MSGLPIQEKAGLPLASFPQSINQMMWQYLIKEEWELEKAEEDLIIENAEIACYNRILQKSQVLKFNKVVEPLMQSLLQEEKMAQWIKVNTPRMLSKLLSNLQQHLPCD